jgi:hypothetical protein
LNKIPFLVLAQRAKLRLLRDQGSAAESLLFGVAGFLEDRGLSQASTVDRDYWRHLWEHWWQRRSQFVHLTLRQDLWRFGMTRPSNHPHRRLAIVCQRLFGETDRAREQPPLSLSAAGAPADLRRFLPGGYHQLRRLSVPGNDRQTVGLRRQKAIPPRFAQL